LAGLSALLLGYIGLDLYLARTAPTLRSPLNVLYDTLQLFVLGSDPLQNQTGFPVPLQIARFVAPAVTLYALTEAVRLLLSSNLRRFQARRSSGHVVVCGSGGVLIDLLADAACRLHPVTDQDAAEMIDGLRGVRLLRGFRGSAPLDEAALRDAVLRISALIGICPEIQELDINPVAVMADGVSALDVRVRVAANAHAAG